MKNKFLLAIACCLIILTMDAVWGGVCLPFKSFSSSENGLIITTDKKVYPPGGMMVIFVKNLSSEPIWFGGWHFDLVWEKWDGTSWQHYESVRQQDAIRTLLPSKEENVAELLKRDFENYTVGRYRVCTAGRGEVSGKTYGPVYAEFDVQEPPQGPTTIWIVPAVVVVAAIGIAIVYIISRRIRG